MDSQGSAASSERGGKGRGLLHYGPSGQNWLQDFKQGHRLELAAQGGPVDHPGAFATVPRRGPAVRCCGMASWKGRALHSQ